MQNNVINVLIVDDHKMVRDGIRVMLETLESNYTYQIEEADGGEKALRILHDKTFDVVLMDQQMPKMSGVEAVKQIIKNKINVKILAVSNYDEVADIRNMINSGASGYILKNITPDELQKAILTVMEGKYYYSNDVAVKLIDNSEQDFKPRLKANSVNDKISKREKEVLKMIASEMTNEQIAKKLGLAKRTVDVHRQNLLVKLNVKNTAGLINYAYKNGLI